MPKRLFYAVKVGRNPGIYDKWKDAEPQVKGFKGAVYQKFKTLPEAEKFMFGTASEEANGDKPLEKSKEDIFEIYVDGSYTEEKPDCYASGIVVLKNGVVVKTFSNISQGPASKMRNVAGELSAACRAFKYCYEEGIGRVTIFYDYEGIAAWCTGEWKANNQYTQKYKAYYDEMSKYIEISFEKVKGHSGNKFNNLADALAKRALQVYEIEE